MLEFDNSLPTYGGVTIAIVIILFFITSITLSKYNVKKNGYFIPYKSGAIEEEIETSKKAVGVLGGKIKEIKTFELPDSDIARSLVIIKKEKETPKKYPRSGGKPTKEPII